MEIDSKPLFSRWFLFILFDARHTGVNQTGHSVMHHARQHRAARKMLQQFEDTLSLYGFQLFEQIEPGNSHLWPCSKCKYPSFLPENQWRKRPIIFHWIGTNFWRSVRLIVLFYICNILVLFYCVWVPNFMFPCILRNLRDNFFQKEFTKIYSFQCVRRGANIRW